MAVCPADRAPLDGRLPRRSGALGMAVCPADRAPPDGSLPSDQTASTPAPCLCKHKKATP